MREFLNEQDLAKNLGVSGNGLHQDMLNSAVIKTGETKSKLVQRLIVKYLDKEVQQIRREKNETYFRACKARRNQIK